MTTGPTYDCLKGFDRSVSRRMSDWGIPGAATGIVKGQRTVHARGYGLADIRRKLPADEHTLFNIASETKPFTAVALGILVDEGKLEWDKPVRDCLPSFKMHDPVATQRVTVRDILTHRTGMPGHNMLQESSAITRAELVKRPRYLEPSGDFRNRHRYSNLMYIVAGFLVEQRIGNSIQPVRPEISALS